MMNKSQFVKTADEDTAQKLRALGYPQVQKEDKFYVFANTGEVITFDESTLTYTDILTF